MDKRPKSSSREAQASIIPAGQIRERSVAEWESHKEHFTQLYIVEDKSLSEVKSIMETQHGFVATERQYKRRIAAWKLDKNIKDPDMKVMLRKQLKRKLEGKESEFRVHGRPVQAQKLARFVQRKDLTDYQILEEQAPTPGHIVCYTPQTGGDMQSEDENHRTHVYAYSPVLVAKRTWICVPEESKPSPHQDPDLRAIYLSQPEQNPFPHIAWLAARVTCFTWFDRWTTVVYAETWTSSLKVKETISLTSPSPGFLRWIKTVLSTTRITRNAVELAILLIYRLKGINRAVIGRQGSEYRLMTVALMLSNKFLDDNFYTNKTWATVSGISVAELHVMEVEFLSNCRYSLYVTGDEWTNWQNKLKVFDRYLETANGPIQGWNNEIATISSNSPIHPSGSTPSSGASGPTPGGHIRVDSSGGPINFAAASTYSTPSLERSRHSNNSKSHSALPTPPIQHKIHGSPIRRHWHSPSASPFVRYCPRYDLSISPGYYRKDIQPTNPLSLLSPYPVRCNSVEPSTPVLVSHLGTTAYAAELHELHYKHISSLKNDSQDATVHSGRLPRAPELDMMLDWPPLSDSDGMVF